MEASVKSKWVNKVLIGLLVLYYGAIVADIALHRIRYQWDFKTYYYTGIAYDLGLNPYLLGPLSEAAGDRIGFPFAYSPITLPLFKLFSIANFETAFYIYLVLKLIALGSLLYLWSVKFLHGEADMLFYLFCLFGFGGALYVDLVSGNISLFEQLGLWLAFYALIRNRLSLFCLLLAFVSLFKLSPILFLVLLVFSEGRGRIRLLLVTGLGFITLHGLSYLAHPELFGTFLRLARQLDERGLRNPSSLALLRDGFEFLEQKNLAVPSITPFALYLALSMTIVLVTWWVMRRVHKVDRPVMVFLACLAYTLIMPRFKDYSYVLLLLPAYYLVKKVIRVPTYHLLLILLMLSRYFPVPFGFDGTVTAVIWGYYPLLTAFTIWVLASLAIVRQETQRVQVA